MVLRVVLQLNEQDNLYYINISDKETPLQSLLSTLLRKVVSGRGQLLALKVFYKGAQLSDCSATLGQIIDAEDKFPFFIVHVKQFWQDADRERVDSYELERSIQLLQEVIRAAMTG